MHIRWKLLCIVIVATIEKSMTFGTFGLCQNEPTYVNWKLVKKRGKSDNTRPGKLDEREGRTATESRGKIAAYYDTSNGDIEMIDTKIYGEQTTKRIHK